MPTTRVCGECGTEVPSDAPEGLCPGCLIKGPPASNAGGTALSDGNTAVLGGNLGEEPEPSPKSEIANWQSPVANPQIHYFGDYELLGEIARGGMGVVYKARQVSLNRVVAVKMILAGNLATEVEVQRFRTEAEAAANLRHPNIVAIHEVGEHQGQHYFSMDYVDGKSLAELTNGEPLHPTTAARYVQSLADAVHFAHQHGTLHRDLKPQNVLVDSTDQPRITDFGLAKRMNQAGDQTRTGAVMGSPNYMSPEQAAGRPDRVGPHSDIYSLGAILYELVTGKPPFRAETVVATLAMVLEEQPVAPRKLNPLVPVELETVCLKCLEKESSLRYASARELAEDLGRLLRQEPILARPSSASRRTVLWFKRNPWFTTAVISAIAVGLVWLAYALWAENRNLVWQKTQPGVIRPADWFTENFAEISYLILPLIAILPWTKPFERKRRERIRTGKRILAGLLFVHGLLAVTVVVLTVYVGTKAIDFHLWDNQPAMQVKRVADLQRWQSLRNLYPHLPGDTPRVNGASSFALAIWLAFAFSGACIGVSLLRKVGQEYLFIMFPSAEQEEIERYCALQEKQHEDKSPSAFRARPRTALRLTAIGSIVGLGVATAFGVVAVVDSEKVSYLVIPLALVSGWAFIVALVVLLNGNSWRWFIVNVVAISASIAATGYLLAHHEHELVWIGLVFGFVGGIAHGSSLRKGLVRCQRWRH